jgi:tripartite-type tricarboxylate transporter receptor subunit TctC
LEAAVKVQDHKFPYRAALAVATPLIFAIAVALTEQSAWSQTTKTMKIIAPAAPGGIYDTMARLLGEQIGRAQGQTVLIENRTGAGGVIAAEAVSRAVPDGSVLLIISPDMLIPPHLRKLNFDLINSFEPICYLVSAPLVLVVNTGSPYKTLGDLLEAARAKPGEITMASFGPATSLQIVFETLKRAANVEMTFLSYPGVAPAINALLGGHVTSVLTSYSTASEQLKAGKLRALATTARSRIAALPEVPTISESGYPGYELDYWLGMLAPVTTPKDKISELAGWFTAALQAPEFMAKLAPLGLLPAGVCGADFAALLRKQYNDFGRVVRETNMKAE